MEGRIKHVIKKTKHATRKDLFRGLRTKTFSCCVQISALCLGNFALLLCVSCDNLRAFTKTNSVYIFLRFLSSFCYFSYCFCFRDTTPDFVFFFLRFEVLKGKGWR